MSLVHPELHKFNPELIPAQRDKEEMQMGA